MSKSISAKASYSESATKKLFGTRDAARETAAKVLATRLGKDGAFMVRGVAIRTERGPSKSGK